MEDDGIAIPEIVTSYFQEQGGTIFSGLHCRYMEVFVGIWRYSEVAKVNKFNAYARRRQPTPEHGWL